MKTKRALSTLAIYKKQLWLQRHAKAPNDWKHKTKSLQPSLVMSVYLKNNFCFFFCKQDKN